MRIKQLLNALFAMDYIDNMFYQDMPELSKVCTSYRTSPGEFTIEADIEVPLPDWITWMWVQESYTHNDIPTSDSCTRENWSIPRN
jgi:hypothetical protein